MQEKEGTIISVANSMLRDAGGQEREFTNPAMIQISDGNIVIYVEISTPNKVIRVIKNIKN